MTEPTPGELLSSFADDILEVPEDRVLACEREMSLVEKATKDGLPSFGEGPPNVVQVAITYTYWRDDRPHP